MNGRRAKKLRRETRRAARREIGRLPVKVRVPLGRKLHLAVLRAALVTYAALAKPLLDAGIAKRRVEAIGRRLLEYTREATSSSHRLEALR